jgi:PAS domain S-box-containing protein
MKHHSEALYRTILDEMPEGCQVIGTDWTVVYLNETAARLAGRSRDVLTGRKFADAGTGCGASGLAPLIRRCMEERVELQTETDHPAPDGTIVRLMVKIRPVPEGVLVLSTDITDRRCAEEELRNDRVRLERIIEGTNVGTWEWNIPTGEVVFNQRWADIVGYTLDELAPVSMRTWRHLAHPEDLRHSDELLEQHFSGALPYYDCECRMRHKDGHWVWVHDRGRVVSTGPDGKPLMMSGTHTDITANKHAVDELQRMEQHYRALIENAPDGIVIIGADGRMRYASPSAERKFGYAPDEMPSLEPAELTHPEDRAMVISELSALLHDSSRKPTLLYRFLHKNGEWRWIESTFSNLLELPGVNGIVINFHDITARKRAEDLVAAQRNLSLLVRTVAPIREIWTRCIETALHVSGMDCGGIYLLNETNQTFELVYHHGLGEEFVQSVSRYPLDADNARLVRENQTVCLNEEETRKSGIRLDEGLTTVVVVPIQQQGHVLGCINLASHTLNEVPEYSRRALEIVAAEIGNVIVYQRADLALRESEELFRLMAENITDMIAVIDLQGRRVYNSPSYRSILGSPGSLRGTDSFEQVHPGDRDRIKQIFEETIRSGRGQRTEYRLIANDGKIRNIESQGSVIAGRDGKPSGVVVVSRDITEKRRIELQYFRAQRMESLGTLAGGIAHDMNNILAPILLSINVLKTKMHNLHDRKMIDLLEATANRGAELVKQVLAFARGTDSVRSPLQIRHLIDEIRKFTQGTFPPSISIEVNAPRDLWTIMGDPTQVHQILLNLCVNARDAMPDGGTITLTAENVTLDEHFARMFIEASAGPYVVISVKDTGTGIPPEIQEKIFEPFFSTKETGKGTGLGLSTLYSIVKGHGGFINVFSEVGKGSEFKIYLPASEPVVEQAPHVKTPKSPVGHGELILLVDDEVAVREISKISLEANGYSVITANDGAEAIALYAQRRDDIRLVVTDMGMPNLDGPALVRVLRNMNPGILIIGASGITEKFKPAGAREAGMNMFLAKPYTADRLLCAIHEVLGEESVRTTA